MNENEQGVEMPRRMLGAIALISLLVVAPLASQEAEILSLAQALQLALENSAAVVSADLQVQRADDELAAARARKLPSFELQVQGTQLLTPIEMMFPEGSFGLYPGVGPIPSRDTIVEGSRQPSARVGATLAQPLTGLHKSGLAVKASQLTRDIDRQELRARRAAVVNDVRRLYYSVLQLQGAALAARDQAESLREMNQVIGRYVAIEAALPSEAMDVKARLAAEEYRIVTIENAVATQKEQLNVLFGRDPGTPFEVAPVSAAVAVEEVDLKAAHAQAIARRPELQQAELQVQLADTNRRMQKADAIPQINLVASYDSFFNTDLLPTNLAQVGIQLKWEPFDWGRKKRELASKTLAVRQAELQARDRKNRVLAEVSRAFRQVQEARALLAVRRLSHESAQEKVRVALLRVQAQSLLPKDLLSAQAAQADARAQYDEAQLSLWQARADLEKAMGEDL